MKEPSSGRLLEVVQAMGEAKSKRNDSRPESTDEEPGRVRDRSRERPADPILSLRGLGRAIRAHETADAHVRRLREGLP